MFAHGRMDEPAICFETFKHSAVAAAVAIGQTRSQRTEARPRAEDFVVLELGPGDSLYTALVAYAHGATQCYLVDDGEFATGDIDGYRAMVQFIARHGLKVPSLDGVASIGEILARCGASYLTSGLDSLRGIPSSTVDFIFSNAVLEHVRRRELADVLRETRRIVKPGGCCFHRIDLQDHLGGALNNLRFADNVWESEFMARSGFYTNRIRYGEMIRLFAHTGFAVEVKRVLRWNVLPTARDKLHKMFRSMPTDDLLVYGFDVVLRPC